MGRARRFASRASARAEVLRADALRQGGIGGEREALPAARAHPAGKDSKSSTLEGLTNMSLFEHGKPWLGRSHLWVIALLGLIVPRRLRADWREEWETELRHREMLLEEWDRLNWSSKFDLISRSMSAFWD